MKPAAGNSGLTLIELITVIAILGILAAIAVPTYYGYERGAARQEATTNLQALAVCLQQYYADNGNYAPAAGTYTETWSPDNDDFHNADKYDNQANGYWLDSFHPQAAASGSVPNYDYQVTINAGPPQTFTATAIPKRGPVADDPVGNLTIDNTGTKSPNWP